MQDIYKIEVANNSEQDSNRIKLFLPNEGLGFYKMVNSTKRDDDGEIDPLFYATDYIAKLEVEITRLKGFINGKPSNDSHSRIRVGDYDIGPDY